MTEANFHLLQGKTVYTISKIKTPQGRIMFEDEVKVQTPKRFIPQGAPVPGQSSPASANMIQFIAREGGWRTVRASDIVDIR